MPGKYILAVDDSLVNRKILSKIISGEYSVIEAENGEMAIEILRRQYSEIAAIILDIVMPVMDGYLVLERVAGDERFKNIPIIIATEKSDNESEIKALRLGVVFCLLSVLLLDNNVPYQKRYGAVPALYAPTASLPCGI